MCFTCCLGCEFIFKNNSFNTLKRSQYKYKTPALSSCSISLYETFTLDCTVTFMFHTPYPTTGYNVLPGKFKADEFSVGDTIITQKEFITKNFTQIGDNGVTGITKLYVHRADSESQDNCT